MPCGLPLICGMLWDFVGRICLKHFRFFLKSWKMPNHRNTWSHQTIAIVQKLENTQPQETAKRGCIPHIPSCNRPSGQQAITVYSFITACASVYIHWGGGWQHPWWQGNTGGSGGGGGGQAKVSSNLKPPKLYATGFWEVSLGLRQEVLFLSAIWYIYRP